MTKKILVSPSSFGECGYEPLQMLITAGFEPVLNPYGRKLTEAETIELGKNIVGVVAGVENYSKYVIEHLGNLECISRVGVGIDAIDLEYAKIKNIKVLITPDAPTQAVAELSVALAFNLLRRISLSDRRIRNSQWKKETGNLLHGKTVGIFGLGRIGKRAASLYKTLGCNIHAYDKYIDRAWVEQHGIKFVSLEELLKESDLISIHVPGLSNGESLIRSEELSFLKPEVILINLSRGGVINENALYSHLIANPKCFAALDVFMKEPYTGELATLDNVVLTPHIGSYAKEAKLQMDIDAVENLLNFFKQSKT
jgi:D-3-phosphoglycerate dehydrogenase